MGSLISSSSSSGLTCFGTVWPFWCWCAVKLWYTNVINQSISLHILNLVHMSVHLFCCSLAFRYCSLIEKAWVQMTPGAPSSPNPSPQNSYTDYEWQDCVCVSPGIYGSDQGLETSDGDLDVLAECQDLLPQQQRQLGEQAARDRKNNTGEQLAIVGRYIKCIYTL